VSFEQVAEVVQDELVLRNVPLNEYRSNFVEPVHWVPAVPGQSCAVTISPGQPVKVQSLVALPLRENGEQKVAAHEAICITEITSLKSTRPLILILSLSPLRRRPAKSSPDQFFRYTGFVLTLRLLSQ
jgi:hypothetical protein